MTLLTRPLKLLTTAFKNPLWCYLFWSVSLVLVYLASIPIFSVGEGDDDDDDMSLETFAGHLLGIAAIGLVVISVLSMIFHWNWYKKYNYIPLILPLTIVSVLSYWTIATFISNDHHFAF
ncbi:hypothetical protein ACFGVR_23650 [Mucilaginibacter sp. AW1-3]